MWTFRRTHDVVINLSDTINYWTTGGFVGRLISVLQRRHHMPLHLPMTLIDGQKDIKISMCIIAFDHETWVGRVGQTW